MQTTEPIRSIKAGAYTRFLSILLCGLIGFAWYFIPHPIIAVAMGIIPIGILFTLHFPVPIGLMFIVFSFFRIHEAIPALYSLHIPFMLSLATISTLLWHIIISQKIKPYKRPEMTAFFIFFMLVLIGIVFAANRAEAMNYFKSIYVKIGIMTPLLSWLLTEVKHFKLALIMVTISGVAVGSVAISNKMNGIGLVEETRVTIGRDFGSVLGDPNDLALVLLFPFSFAISLLITKGTSLPLRLLGLIAAITLFWAIIATQSRGGLLGILSVLGLIAYRRVKSKVLLFSAGALCALVLFTVAGVSGRKSGGAAEDGIDESAMGRIHAWDAAIGMALDNPLTGVGINNFFFNYFFYSTFWDGLNHAVHSTWFGVLAETGFLGLFVFLSMVIITFKSSRNSLNTVSANPTKFSPTIKAISEGNFVGMASFCVSGTFLTQGFTWPLYILIALTAAVAHYVDNHKAGDYGR